jgi:hypothetical protein
VQNQTRRKMAVVDREDALALGSPELKLPRATGVSSYTAKAGSLLRISSTAKNTKAAHSANVMMVAKFGFILLVGWTER